MSFVNLYASRRTYHIKCEWYAPIKNDTQLVYADKPNGYFYARQEVAKNDVKNNVGGFLQINYSSITILTVDNVKGICPNAKVRMNGQDYLVEQVQTRPIKKQTEYSTDVDVITYISLKS